MMKITLMEMELELSVVYDKIKTALSLELQNPDWILLRDERRVIVERRKDGTSGFGGEAPFLLFGESTGTPAFYPDGELFL